MAINDRIIATQGFETQPAVGAQAFGIDMTAPQFNHSHKDAKTAQKFTADLNKHYLHDFSNSGKNDYGKWADNEARARGLSDKGDNQDINAFRHTVTAAIYSMKYGAGVTSELGWANEQKDFNAFTSYKGKINLAKIADTNTDLLNNQSGMAIAKELTREKGAGHVTIADIEDRALAELRKGHLSNHPMAELRSGRLATETISYHSMGGLIKWEAANGPSKADREKASDIVRVRHIP